VRTRVESLLRSGPLGYRRPMVRIGAIVLNVSDTGRAGAFWSQALGYDRGSNPDFLLPLEGGSPRLHLDETDRTHLDLWAANEHEQLAEVERLQALGATCVEWDYPEDADFVVLADPDGNLFCVINTAPLAVEARRAGCRREAIARDSRDLQASAEEPHLPGEEGGPAR
jgi:catechol 2,3-dioxygenase-like lactoylglutathione lyase family enzyme